MHREVQYRRQLGNINRQIVPMVKTRERECYDYMVKIIIVGDSGVGKTNIISRFCSKLGEQGDFKDYHVATIGVDFSTKFVKLEDRILKMQIWDTAGQQRFKTITQTYYKGAAGVVLVYSVDSQESFRSIQRWIQQVNLRSAENVKKVLVANKVDIEENEEAFDYCMDEARKINTTRGRALADKYNLEYYETSAKNNEGIQEMFEDLGMQIKGVIEQIKLVKNETQDVSMSLSLSSKYARSYRKVVKSGIEYKVVDEKPIYEKVKDKCGC